VSKDCMCSKGTAIAVAPLEEASSWSTDSCLLNQGHQASCLQTYILSGTALNTPLHQPPPHTHTAPQDRLCLTAGVPRHVAVFHQPELFAL